MSRAYLGLLSVDPSQQGDYYAPTIGSYDRWAITYGYTDVVTGPSASAAKGGGGKPGGGTGGTGSLTLVMVTDKNANGSPNWGDTVTVTRDGARRLGSAPQEIMVARW